MYSRCAMLCLVAQSCPTLGYPMDYSLQCSSVHGDLPGKNTGVGCHALLQGIFPNQGSNPGLLHCCLFLYCLNHHGSHMYNKQPVEICYMIWNSNQGSLTAQRGGKRELGCLFNLYAELLLVTQSCLTLCDRMDCSPPGSSVQEILQARILEWVAISFSNMQSTSCKMLDWMNLQLESGFPGEISITPDKQMPPPKWQKAKRN